MVDYGAAREHIKNNMSKITEILNAYLRGENVIEIEEILCGLGRGGKLPAWYDLLKNGSSMKNLDGKTIGSVIEMTLVGVLEKHILKKFNIPKLEINPAKGVDIPGINLGVKSPSENFCTSEPFFSAYERLLGNENDSIVLLTDYQSAKKNPPPVRIQIIKSEYLYGSEIAEKNLCSIARKNKDELFYLDETLCKKMLQFLCFVNQSDWRAKSLLSLLNNIFDGDEKIDGLINDLEIRFNKKMKQDTKKGVIPLDNSELNKILQIKTSNQKIYSVINACSDWVIDYHKDFARMPNDNEWHRFLRSPLNGKIGMSFALQWRYDFGPIFPRIDNINIPLNPSGKILITE